MTFVKVWNSSRHHLFRTKSTDPIGGRPRTYHQIAHRSTPSAVPVPKSRAGARLGRRLAVVEHQGRRTGKHRRLVTQYTKVGRTVSIAVGMAERKTWSRNFRATRPLRLRLAGHDYDAMAHVSVKGSVVRVIAEIGDPPGVGLEQ
ncbi:MAG: hypothetical protein ABI776_09530 [Nocardioidaceae bacterium]